VDVKDTKYKLLCAELLISVTRTVDRLLGESTLMTLNDLKHPKQAHLVIFLRFAAGTHGLTRNIIRL